MLRLAAERDEVNVVDDQVGCPTYTGHLAPALVEIAERRLTGIFHVAGGGQCSWYELAQATFEEAGTGTPLHPVTTAEFPRARAAPGLVRAALHRAPDAPVLPDWRDGLAALPRTSGGPPMKLLVCGGAGFIGSNFVRQRVTEHGDEVVVLDKLTYAGREENLADVEDSAGFASCARGIEDADAVARGDGGRDAVVNFAAETHVDRSIAEPDAFVTTHAPGTLRAARGRPRRAACATSRSPPTRSTARSTTARSPRSRRSRRPRPTPPPRPAPTCSCWRYFHTYGLPTLIARGSNNYGPYQYPEKLIPLMVLNALHGDKLPVYGDGMQVRNWIYVEDFARAIGHVLEHGEPGEVYNAGGPDECAEPRGRPAHHRSSPAATTSLIEYVTDRPGHDRRYSLSLGEGARARLGAARCASATGSPHTVAWYRENTAWWEPIRSGDYRAYYERQYGRSLG